MKKQEKNQPILTNKMIHINLLFLNNENIMNTLVYNFNI